MTDRLTNGRREGPTDQKLVCSVAKHATKKVGVTRREKHKK